MDAKAFDDYTERLRVGLESLPEVIGLITLGTTADSSFRDEWSDHDFWVITTAGAQDSLLENRARPTAALGSEVTQTG